jgi:hypothetical protein
MSRSGFTFFASLIVAGCSAAGGTAAGPPANITETSTGEFVRLAEVGSVEADVDGSIEVVWALLPGVYEELGIASDVLDSRTRTYGTRALTANRVGGRRTEDWVRCGYEGAGPSAGTQRRLRLSLSTRVSSAPGGRTRLVTELSGTATPVTGTSSGPVRCVTTGQLERRISELVAAGLPR